MAKKEEDFVASETGEAPHAEDYLGHGEYTDDSPILQGSPHYYKGRLLTTQKELDAARKEEEEERKAGAPDVIVSERNSGSEDSKEPVEDEAGTESDDKSEKAVTSKDTTNKTASK